MAGNRCTYCGNTIFVEVVREDGSLARTCAGPLGCGVSEPAEGDAPRREAA